MAEAFDAGGVRFFPEPSLCTPADILESSFFEEVVDAVREAETEEIEFALDDSKNSISKQTIITNKTLSAARNLFSTKDIQTFEDLLRWLIENPENDAKISSIITDSGYLTMWADDIIKNPYRYFKENYSSDEIIKSLSIDGLKRELRLACGDERRYESNRIEYRTLYGMHELDTIYQQVNL